MKKRRGIPQRPGALCSPGHLAERCHFLVNARFTQKGTSISSAAVSVPTVRETTTRRTIGRPPIVQTTRTTKTPPSGAVLSRADNKESPSPLTGWNTCERCSRSTNVTVIPAVLSGRLRRGQRWYRCSRPRNGVPVRCGLGCGGRRARRRQNSGCGREFLRGMQMKFYFVFVELYVRHDGCGIAKVLANRFRNNDAKDLATFADGLSNPSHVSG